MLEYLVECGMNFQDVGVSFISDVFMHGYVCYAHLLYYITLQLFVSSFCAEAASCLFV